MAHALREAYSDIFLLKEHPTNADGGMIVGKFKSFHNTSDNVAKLMTNTFLALLPLADLATKEIPSFVAGNTETSKKEDTAPLSQLNFGPGLYYNIQIHLPATKDVEVYNAIFKFTSLNSKDVRDFLFRGLMFEAEAETFRRARIQIGADSSEAEENLMREALAPFGVARRNSALEMARPYAVLYCFENEIRDLVREALEEKEGADWQDKLPQKIKEHAETRRETTVKDSWLEGEKADILGFVDFGQLAQIIVAKWGAF